MARYELLNNVSHRDLRVATGFGPQFGDDVGMVPAFPSEFAELACHIVTNNHLNGEVIRLDGALRMAPR